MARAYRGPYARPSSYNVPYATASVWGTGIDPVHSYYGEGPPLRVIGRHGTIGSSPVANLSPRDRNYQNPADAPGNDPPQETTWGYPVEYGPDSFGMGADAPISESDAAPGQYFYMDDRPAWNTPTESAKTRMVNTMPSWGRSGARFRAFRGGAARYRRYHEPGAYAPVSAEQPNSLPTETVSEGWRNKVTSFVADADPSADEQIFVQTSMRQRYLSKDNRLAVIRGTDEERWPVHSRVAAMVEKRYSEGERLYDMFPYQQDQINRPFRYRTAGVGPAEWMEANEWYLATPVQRTPPPDPAMGVAEVANYDYGYTDEDSMYYA